MAGLIIMAICGGIAAAIAQSKGRSAVGWFFGGFFLGIVGIIIVAVLSDVKAEQAKFDRIEQERRRLREQLRQEQLKNEAFRRHAAARLDIHDRALQLDTRDASVPQLTGTAPASAPQLQAAPAPAQEAADEPLLPPPLPAQAQPAARPAAYIGWYYEDHGEAIGPIQEHMLARMFEQKRLHGSTLVCREDDQNWVLARQAPAFRKALGI